MITPNQITKFDRTQNELEQFWVFCWFSKAAKASQIADKVNSFFSQMDDMCEDMEMEMSPFEQIRYALESDLLRECLSEHKTGKYESFLQGFWEAQLLDLKKCTLEDLTSIHGMGHKIARMFLIHSRPDQEYICLDVHLCKEANKMGIKAPKQSPQNPVEYRRIEREMIGQLKAQGVTDFAHFDITKWSEYALAS